MRIDLDIAAGNARHQPVGGQPPDPDREAEQGREHDADAGDQQRVEEPDHERAPVGVGLVVGDQREVDAEAGGIVEEAESARDVAGTEIGVALSANW